MLCDDHKSAIAYESTDLLEKIIAAFVLHNSIGAVINNNTDDLVMVMQQFLHELPSHTSPESIDLRSKMRTEFLSELYRVLEINLDRVLDPQSDKLLRHQTLQRGLSLQAALGFTGRNETRSLSSKLAWTMTSLRIISLTFFLAFAKSSSAQGSETELSKPGKYKSI